MTLVIGVPFADGRGRRGIAIDDERLGHDVLFERFGYESVTVKTRRSAVASGCR